MRVACGSIATLICLACSSERQPEERAPEGWPDLVSALPRKAGAIYAPAFQGHPPDGRFLRLSLHPESPDRACNFYREDFDGTDDLRFIRVTTNRFESGIFAIAERISPGEGLQAEVRIIEGQAGVKTNSYRAVSGTLELTRVPDRPTELKAGAQLVGSLRAGFAEDPVTQSECSLSVDKAGAQHTNECSCTHSSGKVTTCKPEVLDETCCVSEGAAVVFFETNFSATPCSALCAYTAPELAAYCLELE